MAKRFESVKKVYNIFSAALSMSCGRTGAGRFFIRKFIAPALLLIFILHANVCVSSEGTDLLKREDPINSKLKLDLSYRSVNNFRTAILLSKDSRSDSPRGLEFKSDESPYGIKLSTESKFKGLQVTDRISDFFKTVLHNNASFPSTCYAIAEYLNGNFKKISTLKESAKAFYELLTQDSNFIGTGLGYKLTPMVRLEGIAVFDLDETNTIIAGPSIKYHPASDIDLTAGMQISSKFDNDYRDSSNLYFAELKLLF